MIYNWDEEHIDLFIGTGERVKPYTEEEMYEIAKKEAEYKEAAENMEKICLLIEQNGWRYKKSFDELEINIDKNIDKYFSIKARVINEDYNILVSSLKKIKEFIDKNPIVDIDSRYKLINAASLKRFINSYNLKTDYGKIKSVSIDRVSEIIDIDDFSNDKIKIEKPKLFEYLKNNKSNFWQLNQLDKKEAKRNPQKAELHEDILYQVQQIVSKLGDSKIRY